MSIVIECSKYNDVHSTDDNAQWSNNFSPVLLEENDEVRLRNVFIHTESGDSNNILIQEDTEVTMEFYYYLMNNGQSSNYWFGGYYADFKPNFCLEGGQLKVGSHTFTIPAAVYSPDGLAKLMSKKMSSISRPITPSDTLTTVSNKFLLSSDITGTYHFHETSDDGLINATSYYYPIDTARWFGASQVSVVYTTDGKFSFKYAHSPLYSPKGDESVSMIKINASSSPHHQKIVGISKHSGVLFRSLTPASLWVDTLGFNMDDLVAATNTGLQINLPSGKTISDMCTDALMTLDDALKDQTYACPDDEYYKQITDTKSIDARNAYAPLDFGYFLISADLSLNQDYVYEAGDLRNINGICSKQYIQSSYVTGFSDSSINYVHTSQPKLLTSANIRILNPINKQPVTGLQGNSSVFLEVIKNTPR